MFQLNKFVKVVFPSAEEKENTMYFPSELNT